MHSGLNVLLPVQFTPTEHDARDMVVSLLVAANVETDEHLS